MSLIFRKNQNVPLSNSQLDGNFEYLRDQLLLKYSTADFVAENISTALNTPAILSGSTPQTTLQLCESNSLDAWTLRTVAPAYQIPGTIDKTSVVLRGQDGDIRSTNFIGPLEGNADSATTADSADVALSLSNTYTVPIARGGTGANTAAAARAALEVVHTGGTSQMTNTLKLAPSSSAYSSLNFGEGQAPTYLENGDMWMLSDGLYYRTSGFNHKVASTDSPILTGQPQAPNAVGVASQIATISHISDAVATLNASINLKANINSPTFTGTPSLDSTPAQTVNNERLASTKFVHTAVDNKATTIKDDYELHVANAISDLEDTVNAALDLKANLNSPYLTGTPTSVTPARGDNTQKIATTAFTADAISVLNDSIQSALSTITALINSTRPVPSGSVFHIASSVVPNGYLEANGTYVSRFTYATLWAALGSPAPATGDPANTFRLPDLRGEFIRGWDNGRGLDTGRALLSAQLSQNLSHAHLFDDIRWSEISGAYTYNDPVLGTISVGPGAGSNKGTDYDNGAHFIQHGTYSSGGSEARPHNVALMPIIKY